MKIRTDDPLYLNHVDRFWGHLLPRISPLTYQNGGPIVMVQVCPPWRSRTLNGAIEPQMCHLQTQALHGGRAFQGCC